MEIHQKHGNGVMHGKYEDVKQYIRNMEIPHFVVMNQILI